MDARRAQQGALPWRLAQPAEGPATLLALGCVPAPVLARTVEKKGRADRKKNRPDERNAKIGRRRTSPEAREAKSVLEPVAPVMTEKTPGAVVLFHPLDLFPRLARRKADRDDLHERGGLLEALDRARVEGTRLPKDLGCLGRPKRLGEKQCEVVPGRDAPPVALQGFLVVLLRGAEVAVHEPDVAAVDEASNVARSHV